MMKYFILLLMTSILFCGCISHKLPGKHDTSRKVVELINDIQESQENMCDSLSKTDEEYSTPACNSISDPFWDNLRNILLGQTPKLERFLAKVLSKEGYFIYFTQCFYIQTGKVTCTIWNERRGLHCFDIYPDGDEPTFSSIWRARLFSRLLGDEYLEKIEGIDFQGEKKNYHDLYLLGDPYSIITKIKVSPEGELKVIGSVLM